MTAFKTERYHERQRQAATRQAEYDALTLDERIARAESRGHSGTRESRRLWALKLDA